MSNRPDRQVHDPNFLTLSVDPALHGVGVGAWIGTKLITGAYLPRPIRADSRGAGAWLALVKETSNWWLSWAPRLPDVVVVEHMEVYQRTGGRGVVGKPDDLLELQGVSGAIVTLAQHQGYSYLPKHWKGQVPKDVMTNRIRDRLTVAGWSEVVAWTNNAKHDCDIAHGVGIGMYHLGLLR